MRESRAKHPFEFQGGALLDVFLVVVVLVVVKQSVLPLSLVYAGPASTFFAMILATYLLYRRGLDWSKLGLVWPESWLKTAGWTILVFAAFLATAGTSSAIADTFTADIGTSGRFDFVEGNLVGYLTVMALVWTHGSFFEELLFRAFVISKLEIVLGRSRTASVVAVLVGAVFFGYRHYYYQGLHGAFVTGMIGLLFGLIYIWTGRRNIWPLVLTHGLANSIAQTNRFLG